MLKRRLPDRTNRHGSFPHGNNVVRKVGEHVDALSATSSRADHSEDRPIIFEPKYQRAALRLADAFSFSSGCNLAAQI